MKYVVKNCPCYDKEYEECLNTPRDTYINCIDCTDCLIKRVIEEVKWEIKAIPNENDRGDLAERILAEFDIEEVK